MDIAIVLHVLIPHDLYPIIYMHESGHVIHESGHVIHEGGHVIKSCVCALEYMLRTIYCTIYKFNVVLS